MAKRLLNQWPSWKPKHLWRKMLVCIEQFMGRMCWRCIRHEWHVKIYFSKHETLWQQTKLPSTHKCTYAMKKRKEIEKVLKKCCHSVALLECFLFIHSLVYHPLPWFLVFPLYFLISVASSVPMANKFGHFVHSSGEFVPFSISLALWFKHFMQWSRYEEIAKKFSVLFCNGH